MPAGCLFDIPDRSELLSCLLLDRRGFLFYVSIIFSVGYLRFCVTLVEKVTAFRPSVRSIEQNSPIRAGILKYTCLMSSRINKGENDWSTRLFFNAGFSFKMGSFPLYAVQRQKEK